MNFDGLLENLILRDGQVSKVMVLMKYFQEMELQLSQVSFYTQGEGRLFKEMFLVGKIRQISFVA